MDSKPIKCFQHCDRRKNILCFSVPLVCPLCGQDVTRTESRIPPYIITSPFHEAKETKCSVVIKPTVGTFLRDYSDASNLHIGLTDSSGVVYDYDEDGVNVGLQSWQQCVSLEILSSDDGGLRSEWDRQLNTFSRHSVWSIDRYHEDHHNCYDFVLGFLQQFGLYHKFPSICDRTLFTQDMVVPCTHKAGQYISLYREIDKSGYVCRQVNEINS